MPGPHTVLKSITTAVKESDRLPQETSYSTYELDTDGGQANVRPPVVEVTAPDVIKADRNHTDFYTYATDEQGNHIGRIYKATFEMDVEIDVWTAEGDRYDPHELGRAVRTALYRYDARQRSEQLPDPDTPSQKIENVSHFWISDGGMRNDLTMTPALRRWRMTADVWFQETINTAEEYGPSGYIARVISGDGDVIASTDGSETTEMEPADADGSTIVFDATPNTDSPADNY
jgi:hypothetical protein